MQAELRWALIGLGALFIIGLALWEWRRSRRRHVQAGGEMSGAGVTPQGGGEAWPRRVEPRIEPRIDSLAAARSSRGEADATLGDVPVIHPAGPLEVSLPVAHESAVDVPGAAHAAPFAQHQDETDAEPAEATQLPDDDLAPAAAASAPQPVHETPSAARKPEPPKGPLPEIRWPPERADRVLTLRLASAQGALLQGRAVRMALEQSGLVHGPQCIYHRIDAAGNVLASAANMLRPGDLDPEQMDEQQFRGLSLFCVLPGALPPVRMLEELVALARGIAWRIGAAVQDDHGAELDGERLVKLRQSLPDATENGTA